MSTVLELKNVTRKFGGLTAVNNLSLEVEEGKIHALIGPNGSGKTTTLNMVSGALRVTAGSVFYRGQEISLLPEVGVARSGIGRTFQNIKLFSSMTALENVMVGGHRFAKTGMVMGLINFPKANREERELREKAEETLNFLGMYHLRNEIVKNLPYGRQKVLEIGRTIIANPDLILLDEPAAGLNPSERVEFVNLLIKLNEGGKTLFLIEHNMDVVMKISHKITVLNFGAKIAEGLPEEMQIDSEVIKAYLGSHYKKQ